MKKFFPLIEIEITHDYYIDGKCKDLELKIAKNEKKVLSNYNLLFKQIKPWHYILYVELDENVKERIKILEREINEDPNYFSFILVAKENQFFTITKNIFLQPGIQFVNIPIEIVNNNETSFKCKIEDYQLINANSQFEQIVLNKNPNMLAHVTFSFTENSNEVFLSQLNENKTIKVSIEFEAKSVFWKYIFFPRKNIDTKLVLSEVKQLIQFSEIEWTESANNSKAGISYSKNEIKLSEKYPYVVQLWKNYTNGKSLVLNQVSFPNPTNAASFLVDENEKNYISIYQYY